MKQQCSCGAYGVHFGCPASLAFVIAMTGGPKAVAAPTPRFERVGPQPFVLRGAGRSRDLRPGARPSPLVLS
jgi:hypothetical protein